MKGLNNEFGVVWHVCPKCEKTKLIETRSAATKNKSKSDLKHFFQLFCLKLCQKYFKTIKSLIL
jgi:hypothetical protein